MAADERIVPVGRIGAPFGVRGWVKVRSDMASSDALLEQRSWMLRHTAEGLRAGARDSGAWRAVAVASAKPHGEALVAKFDGVEDRDAAAALRHQDIGVPRSALGTADDGEYFWVDLVGLDVTTSEGVGLGRVESLLETGANDVLVIRDEDGKERLVPFLPDAVVKHVSLDGEGAGIVVDWDPEF